MASFSTDEELISLVEERAHLYNKALKSYKDEKLKENCWVTIAQHLKTEPSVVKKRWDNLRDRFVRAYREYTAQPPSGSEGGCPKIISFPYFTQMMWLAPFIRKRKLTSSFDVTTVQPSTSRTVRNESEISECATQSMEDEYIGDFEVGAEGILSPTSSIEVPIENTQQSRPSSSQSWGEVPSGTPPIKRKKTVQDSMAEAISTFTAVCNQKLSSKEPESSDLQFMTSIVQDMQMLSPKTKLKFKTEVLECLMKYVE